MTTFSFTTHHKRATCANFYSTCSSRLYIYNDYGISSKSRTFTGCQIVTSVFLSNKGNELDKATSVGDSNNAAVNGGLGQTNTAAIFTFFFKKYTFLSLNFSLKTHFKWLIKVCWCVPKAYPRARSPTCPPLLLCHWP